MSELNRKGRIQMSKLRSAVAILAGSASIALLTANIARADDAFLQKAKELTAIATAPSGPWTGPTTGPKAVVGKSIIYLSNDQRVASVSAVGKGVEEAAGAIGWKYRLIDGGGTTAGVSTALSQAIALKPDGIVLGGVDIAPYTDLLQQAAKEGIKVDGWHIGPVAGPIADPPIVFNVNTAPPEVGKASALYVVADSNGKAGVVIFTDSTYRMAIVKSDMMASIIKQCSGCELLDVVVTPLDDTQARVPQLTTSLLARFGKRWTYSMGINDSYFDAMAPALQAAGISPEDAPKNIGNDGSPAAFQRIRTKQYQVATAADPLRQQAWQSVDELNRAFAGQKDSGYTGVVHLFTADNIEKDGGPDNIYDPQNGYIDAYKNIWGK
ncbi:substrate-binding domain-containing protein [Mesorhizobium sp. B3-1-6]|nr:substrate-binding domain-containing protein [Mesorhizobium sp. B3-1-6]